MKHFTVSLCGLLLLAVLMLTGCPMDYSAGAEDPSAKLENGVRLLEHQPRMFTMYCSDEGTSELRPVYFASNGYHVIADVPPDQKMWVQFFGSSSQPDNSGPTWYPRAEIHIHGPEDINGAGWSRGKFGSGQTTVVE